MSENEFRQTVSALDISRAQMDNIMRQQEMIRLSLEEHLKARDTLEGVSKSKEDQLLVPVGAGMFLHAKIGDRDSGVASIGAGVLMEKDFKEMIELLDKRIEDLKKAAMQLDEQAEKISLAIEQLSQEAEMQYAELQSPPPKK